jgi:hypothetical protein
MNFRREYLEKLSEKIAEATGSDVNQIKWIVFSFFSIADKKPDDSFADTIRKWMSK